MPHRLFASPSSAGGVGAGVGGAGGPAEAGVGSPETSVASGAATRTPDAATTPVGVRVGLRKSPTHQQFSFLGK